MKKFLLALPCLLLLSLPVVADEPLATRHPASPPTTPPNSATSEILENGTVQMDFPNASVAEVLSFYGKLTGQQVVCDNSVQGSVTLKTSQAVAREQAEAMVEAAMFINGFALVDSEDGSILKVVGLGKSPRSEGLPLFTSAAELPKRERVVSLLINLRSLFAPTAFNLLSVYVPPNSMISFVPIGERALIVTGQTSLVRRLSKVVEAVDTKENTPRDRTPSPAPNIGLGNVPPPAAKKPAPPKSNDEDDDV